MAVEKYKFMEVKWGFRKAPFRAEAFASATDPFSRGACNEGAQGFERKFILGGLRGGLTYGYLWSVQNPTLPHETTGTGYGKTSLIREMEKRINRDFGQDLLTTLEQDPSTPIVAAYTMLNNEDSRGLYAILFSAVERWSNATQSPGPDGMSILEAARARIVERLGCDEGNEAAIRAEVERARLDPHSGAQLAPLREEVVSAFCSSEPNALVDELAQVTPMKKSRNGLAFFEAAFACLAAAGTEHVFLFFDQLEYMVTNKTFTKPQKTREIARFRTVFADHPVLGGRVHVVFTLHERASQSLAAEWTNNRLPSFDHRSRANDAGIVVLRGLESPDKIADLVLPYFERVRVQGHPSAGSIKPLRAEIFPKLWELSTARPGVVLRRLHAALDRAAEENREFVDLPLMSRVLDEPMADDEPGAAPIGDATGLVG